MIESRLFEPPASRESVGKQSPAKQVLQEISNHTPRSRDVDMHVSCSKVSASSKVEAVEKENDTQITSQDQDSEEEGDTEDDRSLVPLHIEAKLKSRSSIRCDIVKRLLQAFILENYASLECDSLITEWQDIELLRQHVQQVRVAECNLPVDIVPLHAVSLEIHVYQASLEIDTEDIAARTNDLDSDDRDDASYKEDDEDVPAASVLTLPNEALEGIWQNLIFEEGIKEKLLNYIYSTLLLSDAGVDFNIISYNRVALLHGPPGTGKTSLCRALAQKLAIRLSSRYSYGKLVEINSHSLFSKWFSESGKLVQKLFSQVMQLVQDEDAFVVVLIDEVESLTSARAGAISGKEPSDALRVVNALLTQLDKLKPKKNVLVMTTSNLSHSIDPAFVDRADIKQFIGLPPVPAVYWILSSCLQELMRCKLVADTKLLDWKQVQLLLSIESSTQAAPSAEHSSDATTRKLARSDKARMLSRRLYNLATLCCDKQLSGRSLRRIPMLAHSRYIALQSTNNRSVESWIVAMDKVVLEEAEQLDKVQEVL